MKYFKLAFQKYAQFTGRASRPEYWYFFLFNVIFAVVAMILDSVTGMTIASLPYGVIYMVYGLATLVPSLAVAVRRLHDVGKSGWMILVAIIPLVGTIWLLVLLASKGNVGENKYGPDPDASQTQFDFDAPGSSAINR
jgi:uncharacterized membrane protein YhaH (DUF805 family)